MAESDTGQNPALSDPVMDTARSESKGGTQRTPMVQVVAPEPLPAFVFPMSSPAQPSSSAEAGSEQAPLLSHELPSPRMPSNLHSRRRSVAPLPTFNFHPGQIGPFETDISPKTPDTSYQSGPPRSGGHRRGGSEFIGGDGLSGGLGLMSASPTKGDGALPLPAFQPSPGPSPGRRGHAHRRSGAISCHDLSDISRLPPLGRPESAPTSPAESNIFAGPDSVEGKSLNENGSPRRTAGSWPLRRSEGGFPRARVGFSDNIEIIPRGLSPISSESSGSQTTLRGTESSTGSLSSIISHNSDWGEAVRSGSLFGQETLRHRATDSGPVMVQRGSAEESRFGDMNSPARWPTSFAPSSSFNASSEATSPYTDDVFNPGSESAPSSFRWSTTSNLPKGRNARGSGALPGEPGPESEEKTNSWSILSRRKQKLIARRMATPPPQPLPPRGASPEIDFDNDNTTVIVTPNFTYSRPPLPFPSSEYRHSRGPSSSSTTPFIDLDAPVETAQTGLRSQDSPRSGLEGAKRRMRSFGPTGGSRGDYHRRTESAPELTDFDFGRSSLHRLRNSSTMADVFEEDEEDEEDVKKVGGGGIGKSEQKPRETAGMGIQMTDSQTQTDAKLLSLKDEDLLFSKDNSDETKGKTFPDDDATEKEQIVNALVGTGRQLNRDGEGVVMDQSSQSWPSAKVSDVIAEPVEETVRRDSMTGPVGLGLPHQDQARIMAETPSMTISSSTSPELATSSTFDQSTVQTPSVFTSSTSITDERTMPPWSMGELSPDMRLSTDDLPSLTSDNASAVYSYASPASRPYSNDGGASGVTVRSGSMTSYATSGSGLANSRPTTAKRSSLVSLSKFVPGSRAEKSKLSNEERPRSDSPDQSGKQKKRGFGRLMSFLKTKQNR
ncbi:MAG: hypothetical protein M1816_007847 [Peltula sp. TS41687]|nr:MAG: hypothetical protein M1816_007847 [Peltula sp. TS41687]